MRGGASRRLSAWLVSSAIATVSASELGFCNAAGAFSIFVGKCQTEDGLDDPFSLYGDEFFGNEWVWEWFGEESIEDGSNVDCDQTPSDIEPSDTNRPDGDVELDGVDYSTLSLPPCCRSA